ncbi:MAG: PAS domain-containing protein [Opitutales bacterium]
MSLPPINLLPAHPRKLLLLSADPAEEAILSRHLNSEDHEKHQLELVPSLEMLKKVDLDQTCHAVLLDIRAGYNEAMEAIRWIGELQSRAALICLCRDHEQLKCYKSVMHLIDDYILADTLPHGELSVRISHAIRRRLKERELLHEQDLLRSLMENIPDAIYFKDRESRFTKVNKAMARNYGHNAESILGKTDFDLFTEEHARSAYEDEQRIIETGKAIVSKIEKETFTDGTTKWVNTTKVALRDKFGRILGTMGISRDVSDLKRAQDTLTEEHRLLSTILNNVPDRIFAKNREGRYIASNRLHMKFLGANHEDEVLGTTLYDHVPNEHADKYFKEDMEIIRTGIGLINTQEQRFAPDGGVIWYLTSKVPLIDETGQCVGLVGISRDVTDQKKNEEKLRNTIEILNDTQLQLIEAEKLKTVGRLAAGVAHEVKNPLNIISLGAEFLRSEISQPQELVEIVEDMLQAVTKANNVISQLLDYSAPREVSSIPQDLNKIIQEVLTMLRHNFNEAHIQVVADLTESLPLIDVDTQKMDQVFINIFLNAISAMPKGGTLTVHTYTQRMKSPGSNVSSELTERFKIGERFVTVEITDTGHGITKDSADKLFEPFYSTNSTGKGTGLGLSVTRSIVEMHRGMITLENRKDASGACATLHFPISPDSHA